MNLGKNVYNLLKRQPEVYVEGLGSFKRNHTPATYDEKRNVYLPPITYIDFDRTSNQGYDFIQYIQQLQLIDRREAEEAVASQVADLLRRVQEDGQAKLDDLGHLVSYGDSYVFKALDLSGFHYEPVEAIAGQPQSVKEETPEPEQEDVAPPAEEGTPIVVEDTSQEEIQAADIEQPVAADIVEPEVADEEEAPTSRSNTMWYIIIVLIALGIMVALYFANQNQPEESRGQVPVPTVDSNLRDQDTTSLSLVGDSALVADSLAQNNIDSAEIKAKMKELLVPEHHTWQIVIGSHKTLAQAYEQAESYNKAGFPKVRVIPSNLAKNRKKVIWDSYETKQDADSALKYVQRHHIRDAWPDQIK
ncbi:hypothetical protein FXV77_03485 [Sphingobacterium phlebotomi]|uniref:CCDC81-like prokaryotic HU domain-containing protein n=1 Tax=Sphingobacterium phlebotomi TaxID=2605433 RepID=A0A5D4HCQ7_9SPHI|nr:hypothetical protein [Sphingobacterium phlebotomi]TYR38354.1 hypothetical protein FXV77_03485 [Sphingobacterium phlebotomi]